MKKLWVIILAGIIVLFAVTIGLVIYNNNNQEDKVAIENKLEEISEKITDDCTEEYEKLEKESKIEIETNFSEEKISPNCLMTLKRFYSTCGHTTNEYIDVPSNLVNKTQEELQEKYPNWKIVLYKEFESSCGEHFVLRDKDGRINIYRINERDEEELYEETQIAVDYLTETDKIEIKNGIKVNGIQNLNELIENFE